MRSKQITWNFLEVKKKRGKEKKRKEKKERNAICVTGRGGQ
jgi:hypothetical protein